VTVDPFALQRFVDAQAQGVHARAVAELLHAVMPNLESVNVWDPESTTPDDDMMHLAIHQWQTGIWRAVEENLNVLRQGGLRASGETEAPGSDGGFEHDEGDDSGDENEVSDEQRMG